MTLSSDEKLAAVASWNGQTFLFDVATGKYLQKIDHGSEIHTVEFIDDIKFLLTSSVSGSIFVHEVITNGREECPFNN